MGTSTSAALKAQHESIWRDRLARHATSNQTIEAFCRSESVSTPTFYKWHKRLNAESVDTGMVQKDTRVSSPFIELGSVKHPMTALAGADRPGFRAHGAQVEVRLDLGNGVMLHIVRS